MEKDIVYHALLEGMEGRRCPVCEQVEKSVRQSMRSILYESMTDFSIRTRVRDARGLCHYHSGMFLQEGDPLAHAILYGDILRSALHDMEYDDFEKYEHHSGCIFCESAAEAEEIYRKACYHALHEAEFMEKYRTEGALCMKHLHAVEQEAEKAGEAPEFYTSVAQATVNQYQTLIHDLNEIQRKNDYHNTAEKWTQREKEAWQCAVGLVNDRVHLSADAPAPKKAGLFSRRAKK